MTDKKNIVFFISFLAICSIWLFSPSHVPELRGITTILMSLLALVLYWLRDEQVALRLPESFRFSFWAWVLFAMCAVIVSRHQFPALFRQVEVFITIAIGVLLARAYAKDIELLQKLTWVVLVSFNLNFIVEIIHWLSADEWGVKPFSLEAFFHVRHFGHMSSAALLLSLPLVNVDGRLKWLPRLTIITATFALMLTAGRASALATIICALIYFCLSLNTQWLKKHWYKALLVSVLFFSLLVVAFYLSNTGSGMKSGRLIKDLLSMTDMGRFAIWTESIKVFFNNIFLGIGPDNYIFIQPHLYGQTPHNSLLQFALAWGTVGALLAFFMLLYLLKLAFTGIKKNSNSFIKGWGLAFISFTIMSLASSTFYQPVNMLLCAFMLGAVLPTAVSSSCSSINKKPLLWFLVFSLSVGILAYSQIRILKKLAAPSEKDLRVKYAMALPFSGEGYLRWFDHWTLHAPEKGLKYVDWGIRNAEYIQWVYLAKKSFYLEGAGELKRSDYYRNKALAYAKDGEQKDIAIMIATPKKAEE